MARTGRGRGTGLSKRGKIAQFTKPKGKVEVRKNEGSDSDSDSVHRQSPAHKKGVKTLGDDSVSPVQRISGPKKAASQLEQTPRRSVSTSNKSPRTPGQFASPRASKDQETSTPKSSALWTPELEEQLVELWQEEENLYNLSSDDYRDPRKKIKSLARIAAVLELPVAEVEKRMKTLRTLYSKVSHIPSGAAADHLRPREQRVRVLCRFLKPHIQKRESKTNLQPRRIMTAAAAAAGAAATPMHESPLEIEEDDNEVPTLPESSLQPKKISKAPAVKRHLPSMGDSDNESVASSYFSVARNGKKKKKDSDDSEHAFLNIADSVSSIASTFKEGGNHKPVEFGDPHVLWSKTLPSKLHEMDKRVAARFKVHVDTLALDAIDGTWP